MIIFRSLLILPPLALSAVLVWFSLGVQPTPPLAKVQERRVPASFVTAVPRSFIPVVSGYGLVAPERVWPATAQVSGQIVHLHPAFARGGRINAGEVLIRIEPQEYQLTLERTAADLAAAMARIEEMRVTQKTTVDALEIEQEALRLVEVDFERTQLLAKRGVVSDSAVRAQQRDVLAQRTKVQSLETTLALLPAQITALERSAEASRVAKQLAQLDLDRTIIKAPFDGRLANAEVELSQFIAVGAQMAVLDGMSVEVDAQIPQARLQSLLRLIAGTDAFAKTPAIGPISLASQTGSKARSRATLQRRDPRQLSARLSLDPDSGGHLWSAEVARTADGISTETRSVGVIVRVNESDAQADLAGRPALIKGMFVNVDLNAPPVEGVILVPRASIQNERVMVADAQDRLIYVPVTIVYTLDDIAVLAPDALPADARIITSNPSPAIEGLLLAPRPDVRREAQLAAAAVGGTL